MRRLPSGDGFLFTSSRIGLLLSGVPERSALLADYTSPPGFSPSCDFDPPRSRIVTLLPPLSPFGRVDTVLSKHVPSFPGPALTAVFTVPGGLFQHCCLPKLPAQDVLEGLVRPTLHSSTVMGSFSSGSLRSPCGFQCFPLEEIIQGAEPIVPSELIPALASRHLL